MPRYRLLIEYDGGPFVGWQRQANGPSVQAALEDAIFAMTGERTAVFGAGRTDAGVHALGQVAHVDLDKEITAHRLREGLNHHLRPAPVVVLNADRAADDFHARFNAVKRHYLYRILNRHSPPALDRGRVWHVPGPLDAGVMHEAAQVLVGYHDFTTFRAAQCQAKSPLKTLDAIAVSRRADEIAITVSARSFLHHQVRSIAGSLKLVGEGKWTAEDLLAALQARDRAACGPVAPPQGLYLTRVDY
ncbi:MAG TPA: tRNA pseudouridine(38-40) synthase TruA [Thermopetrobacter sp.]|nr:tRNA pseudouridine(38-40) synthase TruA [Thermopetrobacter sp.]